MRHKGNIKMYLVGIIFEKCFFFLKLNILAYFKKI
jgi:hypothetical protein